MPSHDAVGTTSISETDARLSGSGSDDTTHDRPKRLVSKTLGSRLGVAEATQRCVSFDARGPRVHLSQCVAVRDERRDLECRHGCRRERVIWVRSDVPGVTLPLLRHFGEVLVLAHGAFSGGAGVIHPKHEHVTPGIDGDVARSYRDVIRGIVERRFVFLGALARTLRRRASFRYRQVNRNPAPVGR